MRFTVRGGVDGLMSRSKHTIPHAQSSPCVNLSIGASARQVQEGVEPKTGNRKIERDIKGHETRVKEAVMRNPRHLYTEHTESKWRCRNESSNLS